MITNEAALLDYLALHAIAYVRSEHPPVYTCEEAARYRPAKDGRPVAEQDAGDRAPPHPLGGDARPRR